MALTDIQIKALKPKEKQYKLFDGGGLYILVHPNGSKYWRLKYRFNGKEGVYSIGVYPTVKLPQARKQRENIKAQIAEGINPAVEKKLKDAEQSGKNSFQYIAEQWHQKQTPKWSERHAKEVIRSLQIEVFPYIGHKDIKEITAPEMLAVLRRIEHRGALVVLKKIKQRCSSVFSYAISTGVGIDNPTKNFGKDTFTNATKTNFNSMRKEDLPEFLNKLEAYQGEPTTVMGLKIALLTFTRTSEIRFAQWSEIDFDNRLWRIPGERMKMGRDHIVPLSNQAFDVFKELQKLTGDYKYVFASYHKPQKQPMSENAMLFGLYRMGYKGKATVHGFRATASTILNETGFNADWIEKQLAHEQRNKIKGAYNRAEYLPQRTKMMQSWADLLDGLKGGNVVPINSKQNR